MPFLEGFDGVPFHRDRLRRGELAAAGVLRSLHGEEFAGGDPLVEAVPNGGVGDVTHAAPESVPHEHPLVADGFSLESLVSGIADGLLRPLCGIWNAIGWLREGSNAGGGYHTVRLVSEVGGDLTMRCEDFAGGVELLPVAGVVGGDLSGGRAGVSGSLQLLANLLAAQAGGLQVLGRVAFDLRCAAAAGLKLVSKIAQLEGEFRLVDGRRKLLGIEQCARLQGARRAVGPFRDVEDDSMGVELGRGVAVDRSRGVMFELGRDELAGGLGSIVPADAGTYVAEQLNRFGLAYLHIIEPRVKGNVTINKGQGPIAAEQLRKVFKGKIIAAGGFEPETAETTIQSGVADAVAFGRHFVANPDLPLRIQQGLALTPYDRDTFYTFDSVGYNDYPFVELASR